MLGIKNLQFQAVSVGYRALKEPIHDVFQQIRANLANSEAINWGFFEDLEVLSQNPFAPRISDNQF